MLVNVLILFTLLWLNTSAQAAIRIEVVYREPADAFEILDNVSEWWPGYSDSAYRESWADSVGTSPSDSTFFAHYARLRSRYFDRTGQQNEDPRTNRSGLFTDSATLTSDPVAFAFYRSETMEEAFQRVEHVVEPDEVEFLRSFYDHSTLILPSESRTSRPLPNAPLPLPWSERDGRWAIRPSLLISTTLSDFLASRTT